MDPNEALKQLRAAMNRLVQLNDPCDISIIDIVKVVETFDGLDAWLKAGGFLPSDWQAIRCAPDETPPAAA